MSNAEQAISTRCDEPMAETRGFIPTPRRLIAAGGVTLGATLALAGGAQAATFTVSNLNDSGAGSLRQAVLDANAAVGPDTVTFASGLSGTIKLTSGDINVTTNGVDIQGPGANVVTVDAGNTSRIFYASFLPAAETFSVSGLTLTGGNSVNGTPLNTNYNSGGAIYAYQANLALSSVVITGSSTPSTSSDSGGGINANFIVSILSSTISGNNTAGDGGGAWLASGNLTIRNSTISGNHAASGGGGLEVTTSSLPERIENSTISGNSSGTDGGGVHETAIGGSTERLTLVGATIAGNSAVGKGGGFYSTGSGLAPVLDSTIVANDSAGSGPDLFGPANSAFSLIRDPSGSTLNETVAGSDITGADPQLGPLASNGGPTQTMAPASTSPAIDKGSAFGLAADQRGVVRPIDFPSIPNSAAAGGDGSDIGAVELQPSNALTLGKLKLNKKKGTAVEIVNLPTPDAGSVTLSGKFLKTQTHAVADNGIVKLKVIAKGKVRKLLKRKGKAKVKETVTYNPTGQSPNSIAKKIKLVKKLKRH